MKKALSLVLLTLLVTALLLSTLTACGEKTYDVYVVEIEVEGHGVITCELDHVRAPITVENFVMLVERGFYNGLTFHRVMDNFMIQGGCPDGDGTGDAGKTIYGEFAENGYYKNTITHEEGVISMARGSDPDSASCQFFITNADATESLDGKYAAFGYVTEGMDVVHSITEASLPNVVGGNGAIPDKEKQIVITEIRVVDRYNVR